MQTVLLVSNVTPNDSGGRAEDLSTRQDELREQNIRIVFGEVPKPYIRTLLPSIYRCIQLVRQEDADLITSISNPLHLQLIGLLVSLFTLRPWIAEFRDPMVKSPDRDQNDAVTWLAALMEYLTVKLADRVVWGDGIQIPEDYFNRRYEAEKKVTKLPFKGYNPENFEEVEPTAYRTFTVTYAGSFYEGWIEPLRFFNGLERYVEKYGEDIQAQFYGDWCDQYTEVTKESGISSVVSHHDFVPHEKIVPILKGSDLLLYIGGDHPRNRLNVPSKIWDYIAAKQPILAIVDPSFRVAELINKYEIGIVVEPDNKGGITEALREVQTGEYQFSPDHGVYDFTRERKTKALAQIYRSTIDAAA